MSKYSVLSDKAILKYIEEGKIVIDNFNPDNLNTSSYDVTLGPYYYREQSMKPEWGPNIYNIYSEEHVKRVWGEVQKAKPYSYYKDKDQGVNLENINDDDLIIFIEPGETILAHTNEFIGGMDSVTTMMKARSSSGRNFLEICKCVSGDSLITLQNGTSVRIDTFFDCNSLTSDDNLGTDVGNDPDNFSDNSDNSNIIVNFNLEYKNDNKILTWSNAKANDSSDSPNSNTISNMGQISSWIKKGKKKCIRITLDDNRTITVTPNHKLLSFNNKPNKPNNEEQQTIWTAAKNLRLGDELVCMHENLVEDIDEKLDFILRFDYNKKGIEWTFDYNRKYILALTRICGLVTCEKFCSDLYLFSDELDVNQLIADLNLINYNLVHSTKEVLYHKHNNSSIWFPQIINICKSVGCFKMYDIPDFIKQADCPKSVLREFIATFIGRSDSIFDFGNDKNKKKVIIKFKSDPKDNLKKSLRYISYILRYKFKIKVSLVTKSDAAKTNNHKLRFESSNDVLNFCSLVGIRYNSSRSKELTIWRGWMNHVDRILYERWKIINAMLDILIKINKMQDPRTWRDDMGTNTPWASLLKNIHKNMGLMNVIGFTAKECYEFTRNIFKDRIDIDDILINKDDFMRVCSHMKSTDIPYTELYGTSKHISLKDYSEKVSSNYSKIYINLKIIKIKELDEPIDVYDISVPNTESFFCNGVCSHNCAGLGDIGYINRWTMEITNNSKYYRIPLVVNRRYAQIIFFETDGVIDKKYGHDGKYQVSGDLENLKSNWKPEDMLPKMYRDRELY